MAALQKCAVQKGREGEDEAVRFLLKSGWEVIYRNFRSRRGEIDIIAFRDGTLAFIEVKIANRCTREDLQHVICAKKRHSIIETSKLFLSMNRKYSQCRIRYDVILIAENACARHMEGAFAEDDETE
jgi:putative endonuclease